MPYLRRDPEIGRGRVGGEDNKQGDSRDAPALVTLAEATETLPVTTALARTGHLHNLAVGREANVMF